VSRRFRAGVVLVAFFGSGCGKKGDPLPPLRPTPAAVTNLRVAQRGDQLEIRFTAPRASTDGARLPVLEVEMLVADKEGDLPKVARTRRIKVAPGETLVERQPLPLPGTALRVAARAVAKGHKGRPGELTRLTVVPPLLPPQGLKAELVAEGVSLSWEGDVPAPLPTPAPTPTPTPASKPDPTPEGPTSPPPAEPTLPTGVPPDAPREPARPSAGPEGKAPEAPATPRPFTPGFFIYKRAAGGGFEAPLPGAVTEHVFVDPSPQPGESLCYEIRAVASAEPLVESAPSNEACIDVKDVRAPAPPTGLTAVLRDDGVEIRWSPSSEADLAAYRVYRVRRAGTEPLADVAVPETLFVDRAPSGRTFRYVVTALDKAGNESPASAPVEIRSPD
jgi:hypothetical protein